VQAFLDEPIWEAKPESPPSVDTVVTALLHAGGAVQRLCSLPVERAAFVRPVAHNGGRWPAGHDAFQAAVPCFATAASIEALNWAVALFNEGAQHSRLRPPSADNVQARLDVVRQRLQPLAPQGINRFGLVQAAHATRTFCQPVVGGLYQLGTGAYARLLDSSVTDKTPALGVRMAASKWLTAQLLRHSGLPAPQQHRVASEQEALRAAQALGYPVVVKPEDQEQGRGVAADLVSPEQVAQAYRAARALSAQVLLEQHIEGNTHRLTVVEDEIIRVTRRQAGGVVGDGRHNIATLLQMQLATPDYQRRARRLGKALLVLDDEALGLLQQKGLTPSSVPADGQVVRLRRRDNINAGGTNTEVPVEAVHPANVQLALTAARLLRLDYAGVDLISQDITQPWWANGAGICEVNARPQLAARSSETRYYEHILRRLMGPQRHVPVRLELVLATTALGAVVARCRRQSAGCVASALGLHTGGEAPPVVVRNGFEAAQVALRRPDVHALTVVLTLDELQTHGLPVPLIDSFHIHGDPGETPQDWPSALLFAMPHMKTNSLCRDSAARVAPL
jgi:cyanophycin synthetase